MSGEQQLSLELSATAPAAGSATPVTAEPAAATAEPAAVSLEPAAPAEAIATPPLEPPETLPPPPEATIAPEAVAVSIINVAPPVIRVAEPARLAWPVRRLRDLVRLMRLDRPIGIWLLLWPELWSLWIASGGHPQRRLLAVFIAGTVVMRSAGCVINDLADRNIDPHVKRTRTRPLAFRVITPYEALTLFTVLLVAAFALVLQLNALTIKLAFIGAGLTLSYPLLKRFFPLPQLYLGLCFGWAVPMAFAATLGEVPRVGWLTLVVAVLWAGVYDTMYAMVDRDDDLRIGVQSSAILFADLDRLLIGVMQLMVMTGLWLLGRTLHFGRGFELGLIGGAVFFLWQQWLIRHRDRDACLQAFQNNNYFGMAVFAGVLLEYSSR